MAKVSYDEQTHHSPSPPSPAEFDSFLPWACGQLQVKKFVHIRKEVRQVFGRSFGSALSTPDQSKLKPKGKKYQSASDIMSSKKFKPSKSSMSSTQFLSHEQQTLIKIIAVYHGDHLFQLKFEKNSPIPRQIFKIIGLIIKFHQHLSSVTINSGLDGYCIHEIANMLPVSNITDICLDGTFLPEANYYALLDSPGKLKYLSLCRCKINDQVVNTITERLIYPLPASKTISVLNLSSNLITDVGANHIADMLRSNRQISYLNLASNILTDEGAECILNILQEFPLTTEETVESSIERITFIKERQKLIEKLVSELREVKSEKKISKNKMVSKKSKEPKTDEPVNSEQLLYQKAANMAICQMGQLKDPFSSDNITCKNRIVYCKGNNALCYLNLAYNNLSQLTIRKLIEVLNYQRFCKRSPIGLVNVSIEGNPIPSYCQELTELDVIIRMGLMSKTYSLSSIKKRSMSAKLK